MSLWSRIMHYLALSPRQEENATKYENQSKDLDAALQELRERHKQETDKVIFSSLDQVSRAEDVRVAVNSIVSRISHDKQVLATAQGALDLIGDKDRR